MIGVALKGLTTRKLRAALTAMAVVLGIAMIGGTFVLTDTMNRAFDSLFSASYENTDAVISGVSIIDADLGAAPTIPAALLDDIRALPDVKAATGYVQDSATLIDRDGNAITTGGAPTFAFSIEEDEALFNPLNLADGRWPSDATEVVIDAGTADKESFAVGDSIDIAADGPIQTFEIVGIAKFGSVDSIGGATFALFDVETAQALFDKPGQFDGISVAGKGDLTQDELVSRIAPMLPPAAEVATGESQVEADRRDVAEGLGFLRNFLLGFGGVALFVGAFVIFNTLSITVAQRTRELATLRTLGASRRQVLGSVLVEAGIIGLVASAIGLLVGVGLAEALNQLFVALGIDLPQTSTVIATRTILVSLLVGTIVTLVAGLAPALRATRVPPIAAVREGAELPKSRLARFALPAALAMIAIAAGALAWGMFADDVGLRSRLVLLGGGVLVLFLGVALVSSHLIRPLASMIGWTGTRTGGVAGRLARANSMRNPGRTAATSAALMIGLALVTFVAVLGQSLRSSIGDAVERTVTADFVMTSSADFEALGTDSAVALAAAPGVEVVSSVRIGLALVNGSEESVTAIEPASATRTLRFDWVEGSNATVRELGASGAILQEDFAKDRGLVVGDPIEVVTPEGKRIGLTVEGIYSPPDIDPLIAPVTISVATFDASFDRPENLFTFANVSEGVDAATLQRSLTQFPQTNLQTRADFVAEREGEIDTLLNLLYVLLALAIVVSLFGMVNTLVLSIFERTREIGMLRAVGMTRRQTRRMIRQESVITGLIGAALGVPLGVGLAAMVTGALSSTGVVFAVPVVTLIVFLIAARAAGWLASVLPARRAARLNVLEALQYE